MLSRLRERHLTYANVMSTIAVFGLLAGGGAYAASKIGPNEIAKNAVRAKHIQANAVRSKQIKNGQVRLVDTSDALRLKCPGGTRYLAGACIEANPRGGGETADFSTAVSACEGANRRLPDSSELQDAHLEGLDLGPSGSDPVHSEWTSEISVDESSLRSVRVHDNGSLSVSIASNPFSYRCVASPLGSGG